MKKIIFFLLITFSILTVAKQTAGINEVITIMPNNIHLEAKFDTGAANSSIDAENIEYFSKKDEEWVRFTIDRTLDKKTHTLEYPLEGHVKIISRLAEIQPFHRRPVIKMDVCIGSEEKLIEVNLTNRENFKYPFLVGASALAEFGLLVDASSNHMLGNECNVVKKTENSNQ